MTKLYRLTTGGEENLITDEFLTTDLSYGDDQVEPFREKTSYEGDLEEGRNLLRSRGIPLDMGPRGIR